MSDNSWSWKGKDGSKGRLLYESGNWGDLLKVLWAALYLTWAERAFGEEKVHYLDPFAGAPLYPLSGQAKSRFLRADMKPLAFLKARFLDAGVWPSTAMAARSLISGKTVVYDADADRFAGWAGVDGIIPIAATSGWSVLEQAEPDPFALWLVDPYDLIAEWRRCLPGLLRKVGSVSLLIYIYNRSAKNAEAFAEYRTFRNALDDGLGDTPKYLGRVASDAFLPRSHHEMLFLPSLAAREHSHFQELVGLFEKETLALNKAQENAGIFTV